MTPGRKEKISVTLPHDIDLQNIPPDKYLSKMLDQGEIEALFTARSPSSFVSGSPNVKRLFPNYLTVEGIMDELDHFSVRTPDGESVLMK